ncbi:hypothetical protein [Desulfobulbus rhabdoformis]
MEADGITIWYQRGVDLETSICTVDVRGWWIFQELVVEGLAPLVQHI